MKGNVMTVCESVWIGAKDALEKSSPSLASLKLVDNDSGKEFLAANATRLRDELKRKETLAPVVVAAVVVLYAVIGIFTFASQDGFKFLAGAVSGVVAALVAIAFAVSTPRTAS